MALQENLNRQGRQHIVNLAHVVGDLWKKCCEHDGIEPGASFVVFSGDNPYQGFYNTAVKQFVEAKVQYAVGGYVGLKIDAR